MESPVRGIAIFGGSFNPLQNMHKRIALQVLKQFKDIDKVLLVTCAQPVHRDDVMLAAELRHEMVAAAIAEHYPRLEACRIEIDRPGASLSADTVKQVRDLYGPDVRLYFVIGTDHVFGISEWEGADTIFQECELLIAPRGAYWTDQISQWRKVLPANVKFSPIKLNTKKVFSSGMVRDRVRAGLKVSHLVPPAVYRILSERGYYKDRGQPNHSSSTQDPSAPEEYQHVRQHGQTSNV
ncbi:MAG: nicotinate (nicotinamide) nucleotide adenylyltransferase [Candidatus Obscuribacterales bacterium]|nr:nicotinate (nicotinamide) nucleotide adenylyltransferase [Candidatus Obscuribacterales bacterium]